MNANILAAPGAPAVLGGPPYGNGVLIIILWANPNPRRDERAAVLGKSAAGSSRGISSIATSSGRGEALRP